MKENEYLTLLFKQLSGDISPDEALLLQEWTNQSSDNQRLVKEYSLVWSKSADYNKQFSPNLDADFSKVQARIRAVEQPVLKVVSFRRQLLRVAAAVALLAISVWAYSTFGPSGYYDTVASAQEVEKQLIPLSDGTQVWLRKGSTLQYAHSFEGKKERRVKLTGEAYFEVAHDPAHPFRVELDAGASVEVLGTQFDVSQSNDATMVFVRSGKVKFSPDGKTQTPVLTANQKAVFDRNAGTIRVSNTTTLNDLAWQTGGLEFVRTPLSQVVTDLERYYKVRILLRNPALADCPHSALLANQPLKTVLDGLAVAYQLKVVEVKPGEFALSGGRCQ